MLYTRRKLPFLLLTIFLLSCFTATANAASYSNVYYAIESYTEKDYAIDASQIAIGWSEIRKNDDKIYFSQQRISTSVYGVPVSGDIPALIRELKSKGSSLNLSVFLADNAIFRELLDSPTVQDQVISDMVDSLTGIRYYDYNTPRDANGFHPHKLVTESQGKVIEYDGIIIDFEELFDKGSYSTKYNQFLKKLKDKLPRGKKLTVCIPPKRKAPITYYNGYDYSYIGRIADEVILMAHDYQWGDGSIKASAPINYVKEALEFAIKEIPKEKILLQVSMSPVLWRDNKLASRPGYGEMLTMLDGKASNQVRVISVTPKDKRYNEALQLGYALLKHEITVDNGTKKIVTDEFYYETAQSIAYKKILAGQMGIKGMSLWRLGLGAKEPLEEFLMSSHVRKQVEGFVERLYTIALNRKSDAGGLTHYTDRLILQSYDAAYVVQYILLDAPEFLNKNLTNEEFVEISYRTFFNRMPDTSGKIYWLGRLEKGYSKKWVIANMLNAPTGEFEKLCNYAGIKAGRIRTGVSDLP